MALYLYEKTSNLVAWGDGVLVGAGASLLHFDHTTGEVRTRVELAADEGAGVLGDIMSIAVADSQAYVATSGG